MTTVAVVGGGAAGVVTAAHLARRWPAGTPLRVVLFDAGPRPARGVAYATSDRRHLLNVPAANMSALSDEAGDFVAWLRERDAAASGADFRSRAEYGEYLEETLADCAAAIGLAVRRTSVTDVVRLDTRYRVVHNEGSDVVDACVLALGHAPPADLPWVTTPSAPGYVRDPRAPGAIAALEECTRPGDAVLLVGCGLTAVDVALTLTDHGRRVLAVSRHGWLPRRHRVPPAQPHPLADEAVTPLTAVELERLVARHVQESLDRTGCWRPAVDGLRPVTRRLWSRLPVDERRALLAGPARRWEVLRHRMAPVVADAVDEMRAAQSFAVRSAELVSAAGEERSWHVTLRSGGAVQSVRAAAVVNCTGVTCDITRYPGGLGRRLLESGLVVADELGLGVRTDGDGAVIDAAGRADGRLWTLGALRRGALYESAAMPELRDQAATIAEQLAATLPVSSRTPGRPGPSTAASSSPRRASAGRG